MTEKRFVCYFDDILKKWCVQDTDSLDMHYVADEPMGEEFAHLLNLYQQRLDTVENENEQLKQNIEVILKYCREKGKYAMDMKEIKAHNVLQRIVNDWKGDVE